MNRTRGLLRTHSVQTTSGPITALFSPLGYNLVELVKLASHTTLLAYGIVVNHYFFELYCSINPVEAS